MSSERSSDIVAQRRGAEYYLQQLETVANNATLALFIMDERQQCVYMNRAAEQLTGYSLPEVCGRALHDVIHHTRPDGSPYPLSECPIDQAFPQNNQEQGEEIFVHKDGSFYPVAYTASPIREGGIPIGTIIEVRDIREQKRVEAELRERARQAELGAAVGRALTAVEPLGAQLQRCAEALVEHLDAAFARFWTLNEAEQTLELQASAGMYTRLDGPHGRVPVGAHKIGRIAAERKPRLTNHVPADPRISDPDWARREGIVSFAGYPLLVGGRLVGVMALFAKRPLPESTPQLLGSVADVIAVGIDRAWAEAERMRLLEREREARLELETLQRVAQTLSSELDLTKLVQAVTDAATSLSGAEFGAFFYNLIDERGESYTLYALSGAPLSAFEGFPMPRNTHIFGPTFRGEGIVRLDDVTRDPRYGQNPPYHGMPSGHLPVRSYLAVPVKSRGGEVVGGLFFGHHVSGVFTEQSERLVAGIAAWAAIGMDNARLYQQVHDAVRTRDEFLASAAHDLKTPLTSIKGMSQFLRRLAARGDTGSAQRVVEGLAGIDGTATQMATQIDELLDLTRLQMGQPLDLRRAQVDLLDLVRRVIAQQQRAAGQHAIQVESDLAELTGSWDVTRLARAIDNLVSNAVKFSPDGGKVVVRVARADDGGTPVAAVTVRDEGLGIPADDLPRIFERFHRGGNVIGRIAGAGIGLASARQIVEQHGGTIAAESREGIGSAFTIRLPLGATDRS